MREVLGEPGGVDDYQGFVIGMGSRWRPVEAAGDHFPLIDHGELVVDIVETCLADCDLRGAQALKARIKAGLIAGVV